MSDPSLRVAGLAFVALSGGLIAWLYVSQPQTVEEIAGGLAAQVGAYRADAQAFADGMAFFEKDAFEASRAAFKRADPASRDARTQFYVAYSYYRQGFGRIYNDDVLFRKGLEAIDRAIAATPEGRLVVDDPKLGLHSADELRAELLGGVTRDASDWNPLRVLRSRK